MADPDVVREVSEALACDMETAAKVDRAFQAFFAEPLARQSASIGPSDIVRRNPFVYAALGTTTPGDWTRRVIADKLTSSAEGLIGNWIEEVARIVSGGVKTSGGADLLISHDDGRPDELYAIQCTINTKNASGRRGDIEALERDARRLRAQRREVELYVGFAFGRKRTTVNRGVTNLASAEFWRRVSGRDDFLPRLLHACTVLARAHLPEALRNEARIIAEVDEQFGDGRGGIDWGRVFPA